MIELFINYDCDLEASNLFSKIVIALSKIAKNPPVSISRSIVNVDFMGSSGKKSQQEEILQLRSMGLEGLTMILKSLITASNLTLEKESNALPTASEDSASTSDISIQVNENDTTSTLPSNIVETFDKKLKLQQEIDNGILKFTHSPIQALRYLHSLGHIAWDPKSVALFLIKYQDKLDKTQVGEFLGREKEYENGFAYKVLHEYVEALDFSSLKFDTAIRHFLYGFRLPGEAQKIDRIMEKFAERYYIQHQNEFANADMAFILAFSTIMLQTNLHNPAIKEEKKMTKEQFVKQNKGISTDGELSDELLMEIYDRIAAEPISMNDGKSSSNASANSSNPNSGASSAPFVVFQSMNEKKKKEAFNTEIKEMVRAGEAMIKLSTKRRTSTAYITHSLSSTVSASSNTTPINSPTNSQSETNTTSSTLTTNNIVDDNTYLIKPMFESVWPPVIGVLSQTLETSDEPRLISFCIQAFKDCIFLACRLDFPVARNTFINALAKFTTLDVVKEMKIKNILCIKLLLQIAFSEAEYLEKSWSQVLQCVSLLSRLQLFATGSHTDDMFFSTGKGDSARLSDPNSSKKSVKIDSYSTTSGNAANTSILPDQISKFFSGMGIGGVPAANTAAQLKTSEQIRQIEEANAELLTQSIDMVMIDKLFLKSTSLTPTAVLHFVRALCEVSLLEISSGSIMNMKNRASGTSSLFSTSTSDQLTEIGPITIGSGFSPRTFSLQKLVEVADYNMNVRSRYDWSLIWKLLATQFSSVGLSDNTSLAMFAIDSLKQLSIKFLQKDELSNFNFQKIFLHPFEIIITKSNNNMIKDLVLGCIDIMIKTCSQNIRSGWKTIFSILSQAATQEDDDKIANEGMLMIERMMENQFNLLIDHDFVDLMNCLVTYAKSKYTNLSLKALNFLAKCADHLVESESTGSGLSIAASSAPESNDQLNESDHIQLGSPDNEESRVFKYWWPLLLGLATRGSDSRKEVRVTAVKVLGEVLRSKGSGSGFSLPTWSMVFKGVLYPMVDAAKLDDLVLGMNHGGNKGVTSETTNYHYNTQTNTIISTPGAPVNSSSSTLNASQLHWVSNEVRLQREVLSSATRSKREWVDSMARDVLALCLELYLARREEITNMKLASTQQSTLDNESSISVDVERESELLPDLLTFLQGCICQDLESLSVMALQVTRTLLHSLSSPIYIPRNSPKNSSTSKGNFVGEVLNNNNLSQNHFELRVLPKSHTDLVIKRFTESLWANLCFEFVGGLGKISLDSYPCPIEIKEKAKSHPFLSRWQGVGGDDHDIIRGASSNDLESLNSVAAPSYSAQDLALILTRLALTQSSCYRVTLALPLILTRFALTHSASLSLEHWESLLMALEATHWQAYALNENLPLRHRLSLCGIMKRNNKVKKVVVMKKMMMAGTPNTTNINTPQTCLPMNSITNSPNVFEDDDDWWLPEIDKDVFDETGNDFLDDYRDDDESDDEEVNLNLKPKSNNLSIENSENYYNNLPDVLQQEVQVLHLLLQVIFYLYFEQQNPNLTSIDFSSLVQQHPEYSVRSHSAAESRTFIYQYFKRIITLLIERFCSIELILFPIQDNEYGGLSASDLNISKEKSNENISTFDDDDESDDSEEEPSPNKNKLRQSDSRKSLSGINSVIVDNVFLSKRYLAYERVLVFTLTQLFNLTKEEFDLQTREWIIPLLNRLILTSSRPVRIALLRLLNSLYVPILMK